MCTRMKSARGENWDERVLLEREGLLVIDKPAGIPTSGRSLEDDDCVQHGLMARHGGMVWAVHQLDADTSGVNLFCTRKELVEPLKRSMEDKRYRALVRGVPDWLGVGCAGPIGAIAPGELGVVDGGRAARTTFHRRRVLRIHGVDAAEVEVQLHTGRTHQIRIHAAHLGLPLIGEEWYGPAPCQLHGRQALHAESVVLGDPFGIRVRAPWPADLAALSGDPPVG